MIVQRFHIAPGRARKRTGRCSAGRRAAFEFRGTTVRDPQPVWRQVVGVVRTVRQYGLTTPSARSQIYVSYEQPAFWFQALPAMSLTLRTSVDAAAITASVRQDVSALDPAVPVYGIRTMTDF